jgi:predicted DsbA family dithiol-disulfide isomerase
LKKLEVEIITKPRQEYQTTAYAELGMPKAPAIVFGGKILVEGHDVEEQEIEQVVSRHLAQS